MKKIILPILLLLQINILAQQNVGIGTLIPHPSSILDLQSSTKGILIPRMTTAQMNAIATPAKGLIVYDSLVQRFYFFDNGFWNAFPINNDLVWAKNGANIYKFNTGNVGIGTSTPATLFHVFRGSGAGGVLPFGSTATIENSGDVSLSLLTPDANISAIHFGLNSNSYSGAISYNSLFNKKGFDFRVRAGVATMVIDSLGYVGMGNLSPKSPLHVTANGGAGGVLPFFSTAAFESNTNTFLSLLSPNANEAGVIFGLNSNNISGSIVYNNSSTPKGLQFRTRNNLTQMVLDSLGRVGIGTTTPGSLLDVKSTTSSQLASFNGPTGLYMAIFENNVYRGYWGSYSGAAADVDFGTGSGNSTGKVNLTIQGSPQFSIDPNGNTLIYDNNLMEFGYGVSGKEINAGKIGYNAFGQTALTFVGAGTSNTNRAFYFYNEGGASFGGPIYLERPGTGQRTVEIKPTETGADGAELLLYNAAGSVTIELDADYGDGDGRVITRELQITGGSDLAEPFSIDKIKDEIKPGMLVSIDEKNEGKLKITNCVNDKKVVGVISGANGIKAGMLMSQQGTIADGEYPVALAGRVYVYANTEGGEIEPGDLITTSSQKGYAMKAASNKIHTGTIIGKAMGKINEKTGLVLVLVNLQ